MPKIVRPAAARQKVSLSKTTFNAGVAAGRLPQPVTIIEGGRCVGLSTHGPAGFVERRQTTRWPHSPPRIRLPLGLAGSASPRLRGTLP
jgi:hypothetical protein